MRATARHPTCAVLLLAAACAAPSARPRPAPPPAPATPAPPSPPRSSPRSAGLSIATHERYYDVTGANVAELRDAIRRLGPQEQGQSADALTVWDLEWTYGERPGAGACALRDVRVTLTVTMTLPRWDPPADAPARLIAAWREYLDHVKLHEAGHRAIAEQYAHRLLAALTELRAATCDAVWDAASRTAARVNAEGQARNRAYDVETRNGQTQGVVLEP
jgi:predicted secreted Zn-dependent protease